MVGEMNDPAAPKSEEAKSTVLASCPICQGHHIGICTYLLTTGLKPRPPTDGVQPKPPPDTPPILQGRSSEIRQGRGIYRGSVPEIMPVNPPLRLGACTATKAKYSNHKTKVVPPARVGSGVNTNFRVKK